MFLVDTRTKRSHSLTSGTNAPSSLGPNNLLEPNLGRYIYSGLFTTTKRATAPVAVDNKKRGGAGSRSVPLFSSKRGFRD